MLGAMTGVGTFLDSLQGSSFAAASPATLQSFPETSALTADEIDAFCDVMTYAVLSTTRPDGRPHAAPVGYLARGQRLWIASVAGATRLRNLSHRPAATLVVTDGQGDSHVALIVEGTVSLHLEPQPILDTWLRDAWRERFGTDLNWARALIELDPTKVLSYGHGRVPVRDRAVSYEERPEDG